MSFFEKVKQGASEAAKKAQQTVEITRLKTQISSKEKEIERNYSLIGEVVYKAFVAGDLSQSENSVTEICQGIISLEQEITTLEQKIIEVRNEKECVCGKVVLADTKFCPGCGHKFDEIVEISASDKTNKKTCNSCQAENEMDAKFCRDCGNNLIEE